MLQINNNYSRNIQKKTKNPRHERKIVQNSHKTDKKITKKSCAKKLIQI